MVRRQRNSAQQIIMKILFGLAPFDAGRTGRRFCSSCSPSGRCRPTRVAISSSDTFDGPPVSMGLIHDIVPQEYLQRQRCHIAPVREFLERPEPLERAPGV